MVKSCPFCNADMIRGGSPEEYYKETYDHPVNDCIIGYDSGDHGSQLPLSLRYKDEFKNWNTRHDKSADRMAEALRKIKEQYGDEYGMDGINIIIDQALKEYEESRG